MPTGRYPKPFEGRPAPLQLENLFMFSPYTLLRFHDLRAPRSLFIEEGQEALFKRAERLASSPWNKNKVQAWVEDMLAMNSDLADHPVIAVFNSAIEGDQEAITHLQELGSWGAVLAGITGGLDLQRGIVRPFILELERLSARALASFQRKSTEEWQHLLSTSAVVRQMLPAQSIPFFLEDGHPEQLALKQFAAAIESTLGLLAAVTVEMEERRPDASAEMRFLFQWEDEAATPMQQLFCWLVEKAGKSDLADVITTLRETKFFHPDTDLKRTMGRWSSGKNIPELQQFRSVCKGLRIDQELADRALVFTRYLNFLAYYIDRVQTKMRASSPERRFLFAPWPDLPHGYRTFEAWAPPRFDNWCVFHRTHWKADG